MQDEVWEKAIANARERAEKILKWMGVEISTQYLPCHLYHFQKFSGTFSDRVTTHAAWWRKKSGPHRIRRNTGLHL